MQIVSLRQYGRWKGRSIGRIVCATLVWIIREVCGTLLGHIGDEAGMKCSAAPAIQYGQLACKIDARPLDSSSSVEVYVRVAFRAAGVGFVMVFVIKPLHSGK